MPTREAQAPSVLRPQSLEGLRARLEAIERTAGARSLAVAVSDTETGSSFRRASDRWFHAASTIKVAILLGVYAAIHR
jgi:beta-lactamase class A